MKKLLTLIGAAATAFGLYATTAPIVTSRATFENEEIGPYDLRTEDYGNLLWWAADTNEITATVAEYDDTDATHGDQYLALETGSDPLFRTAAALSGEHKTVTQLVSVAGGVYFDQRVKFTAFEDEPPALANDAKIAVWLKADDVETNLYVSTAVIKSSDLTVDHTTNLVLRNVNVLPDSWHQLRITAIPAYDLGNGAAVLGFAVQIDNGEPLEVSESLFPATNDLELAPTPAASKLIANKQLMASRVSFEGGEPAYSLIGVGYQGAGSIDTIAISAGNEFEVIVTNTLPANVTAVATSVNGYEVGGTAGAWVVAKGDTVTVTFTAASGYTVLPASKTFTDVTTDSAFDFSDVIVSEVTYPVVFFNNGYDEGGVAYLTNDVVSGQTTIAPAAPAAPAGKSFAGWFETNGVEYVAFDFATPITKALDLFAQFTNNVYTLTLTPGENATLTASPAGPYTYGDKVTLTAAPVSSEYEFTSIPSGWYQDGDSLTNLVTISESASIVGPDAEKKAPVIVYHKITITTNATVTYVAKFDDGTAVTFDNDVATVEDGTNVTIIATAVSGYTFASQPTGWTGTGSSVTNVISGIDADVAVTLPTATQAGWDPDPGKIDPTTKASDEYPALAGTLLANANAQKLTIWAKANSVDFNDAKSATTTMVDAYLLNCAATAEAVAAAQAAFKATITVDGSTITVTAPSGYNVTPQMQGSNDLSTWTPINAASSTYKFYKYTLSL